MEEARVPTAESAMTQMRSTNPADIAVNREQREMRIRWQDGHESVYPFDLLRTGCRALSATTSGAAGPIRFPASRF